MAAPADYPKTAAEKLISLTVEGTWLLWVVGGLYIAGPALGWTLAYMAARALYLGRDAGGRPPARPGAMTWLWVAAMLSMLLVLIVGHVLNDLGTGQTIKSTVGWAKGWALLALFPLAGAVLWIRPEVLYRSICRLGLQTLGLLPFFLASPFIGLPSLLYVSPLQVLGGSGPEFFAVILYTLEPGTGVPRWQFFAPWAPAAGVVAVVYILCALEERRLGWKIIGVTAGMLIALLSQSRLAIIAAVIVWPASFAVAALRRPIVAFAAAPLALLAGLFANSLKSAIEQASDDFKGARADSSRVRAALGRIAYERGSKEAPWFGHGIVERGPHLVEYMPIGSHHSWYGLIFVKGFLGVASLALPLFTSLAVTAWRAGIKPGARVGFAMTMVLFLYTFGENLEVLGYLIWPGLLLIGVADRHPASTPHA